VASEKRILIVYDDPDVLALLRTGLGAPDREIETVSGALAGFRRVAAAPYDLILASVAWIEGMHKIRPNAKVAAITAASTPDSVILALRHGAIAYFAQPLRMAMVSDMVERALIGDPAQDDIELLSDRADWLEIRIRSKLDAAERIVQFLRGMCLNLAAPMRENLSIAVREILLNAIEHGAGNDPEKRVMLSLVRTDRAILFFVRDPGKGFSFEKLEHAAVSDPNGSAIERAELRERLGLRPGGFGLLMTRQLVDEMIYNQAGNEVLLVKYLSE